MCLSEIIQQELGEMLEDADARLFMTVPLTPCSCSAGVKRNECLPPNLESDGRRCATVTDLPHSTLNDRTTPLPLLM